MNKDENMRKKLRKEGRKGETDDADIERVGIKEREEETENQKEYRE